MSKFRGQYIDIVDPSSDVYVMEKPNKADLRHVEEPPRPEEEIPVEAPREPEIQEKPKYEPDFIDIDDEPKPETKAYDTPFLPNVEVEKRPLGGLSAEKSAQVSDGDARDAFDINDFVDLSEPELPADDGGKGELEPELPSSDETVENIIDDIELLDDMEEPNVDHLPRYNAEKPPQLDTRAALANTMIVSQYKTSETAQLAEPDSPFAHVSAADNINPAKKHFPIWGWILLFVVVAITGVAVGALIYLVIG